MTADRCVCVCVFNGSLLFPSVGFDDGDYVTVVRLWTSPALFNSMSIGNDAIDLRHDSEDTIDL